MPRRCAEGPQQGWQPDPHSPSVVNYINQGLDNPEYGGAHRPPDNEAGNTLDNLTDIYPSDIYSPAGARLYGHGGLDTAADQRVVSLIRAMKGKPNAKVTIYRAIPSNAESSEINEGDWVTIDRDYAVHHGNRSVENPIIVSKVVRAKDLTTEGNSIYEWGYAPNKALAKTALSAGVAGIKDGTSEGGTYNMDGTTYDGNGIAVGVDSLPPMTAKQITDEKVETFRQKFMQGHKPWEKIGLFKFPEDRYASVDFT